MILLAYILALACFIAAAFGVSPARVNLLAAGLAFVAAAEIIARV